MKLLSFIFAIKLLTQIKIYISPLGDSSNRNLCVFIFSVLFTSKDINECLNSTYCDGEANTRCVNTDGNAHCVCLDGFSIKTNKSSCTGNMTIKILH